MTTSKRKSNKIKNRPVYKTIYQSEKKIFTNEDWHPTIDGQLDVILRHQIFNNKEYITIRILGGDDTNMDKYYDNLESAKREFKSIVHLITKDDLIAKGFYYF